MTAEPPVLGAASAIEVGSSFRDRRALHDAALHRPLEAGIDYAPGGPAASVVLSGVYPDDDQGDVVIYTGQGGLERGTQRAVADQPLNRGNAALIRNSRTGVPVRVIRRVGGRFRYDGLYSVDRYFRERFSDGYVRWRYELRRIAPATVAVLRDAAEPSGRIEQTVLRIVRQTALARTVKEMYDYTCQVCEVSLPTAAGPYAEAAHIRPLGRPHNGRDDLSNLLCLCPNDHVLFDFGGITVSPETFRVTGERSREGRPLTIVSFHHIDPLNLDYHNEAIFVPIVERLDR
ncbi:MAG: YDG/SRA domain-containing protein [Acidobacteriaceae bacterium]